MKKLCALLALTVILSGCSHNTEELQAGMALRTQLLKCQSCCFDTEITADYGDKIYSFSMNCRQDGQKDMTFSVTQPDSLTGITGQIGVSGGKLTFDEVALEFTPMADEQITPVMAPWVLLKTLRSGNLTSAGKDGDRIRLSLDDSYEDNALHLDVWLNSQGIPVASDILYDGRRIVSLCIENFVIS